MNYRQKKKVAAETPDLFSEPLLMIREDQAEFFKTWNSRMWLPKLITTDRQCALIKNAMLRPFFQAHWREAIAILAKCHWLVMKKRPRLNLDFFCDRDNFDKIMEGFYIDEPEDKPEPKSTRNGDDEEIL